jgi:uncharacterized membrane protein
MISRFRTFIAGFLVVLPLAVTIPVIAWVGTLIYSNLGPVLVPSAPVPVGGCLVYVPVQWVKPADFGVEAQMSHLRVDGSDLAADGRERPEQG